MKNHYQTLNIDRNASADEIKRAYRKYASLYHPDKEGGSKVKFQEIEEAYRTLSDPQKRAEYDNPGMRMHGGVGGSSFDFDSIFDIFGARFQHASAQRPRQQARMTLWVSLADAATGGTRSITVGTHAGTVALDIEIPLGIEDGDNVQYPKLAPGGIDLVIQFRIHPMPGWIRKGLTLICTKEVSLWDCILGGETTVFDVLGNQLTVTIPPRTNPGTTLRLKGRGLQRQGSVQGDIMVQIQATIPDTIDSELLNMIEQKRQQ